MEDDVISIDTLSDRSSPELEIVSSEVAPLTPKELRIKLLNFLVVSPPPSPVQWKSFKEFVMARFKDYYPKDVIADVYDQLQTAWSSKQPSADSDVDSERQSNSSEASTSLIRPSIAGRPVRKAISIAVQATENDWDNDDAPSPRNDSPPLFSKGEIQDLCHKDSAVKKRSNYIKEMYGILNTIQDTTSCSVCKKLKIRLDKFKNYLSSESLSIRKKVIQRRSKSNLESGHQRMQNIHEAKSPFPVLSVHKEQLVRDYLVKKVIEASMPEIVKMTEARMDPIPNQEMTNTNLEASTSVNGRKKSGKSKPEKAIGKAKRNSSDEVTAKSDSEVSDSEKQEKKKKKRKSEESWYWENGERSLDWDPEIDPLQAVDPLKIESDTFADSGDSDTRHSLKKKMKKSRKNRKSIDDDLTTNIDHPDSNHNSSDSHGSQEFHECRESFRKKKKKNRRDPCD